MKRRNFLKLGAATGILSLIEPAKAANIVATSASGTVKGPIVLSTWIHGLDANKAAWEVLKNGGSALDAVEKAFA